MAGLSARFSRRRALRSSRSDCVRPLQPLPSLACVVTRSRNVRPLHPKFPEIQAIACAGKVSSTVFSGTMRGARAGSAAEKRFRWGFGRAMPSEFSGLRQTKSGSFWLASVGGRVRPTQARRRRCRVPLSPTARRACQGRRHAQPRLGRRAHQGPRLEHGRRRRFRPRARCPTSGLVAFLGRNPAL